MDASQLLKLRNLVVFHGSARFEGFSNTNPKNRAEEVQNLPASFSSSELSSHQMAVRRSFRQTSKLSSHQISV